VVSLYRDIDIKGPTEYAGRLVHQGLVKYMTGTEERRELEVRGSDIKSVKESGEVVCEMMQIWQSKQEEPHRPQKERLCGERERKDPGKETEQGFIIES
jgi:hypothetical protein